MIPKKCCLTNRSYYRGSILLSTLLSIFLIAVLLVFPYPKGHCSQVTLTWDPNTEPDLAGYDIYYGTASGNYQWKTDVGNATTYTQSGLNIGATYYFAATAYNTQGLSSGFSNEVVYSVPSCTFTISPSSASFAASGGSGSVLVTSQAGCNWGTSTAPSWITVNSGSGMGNGTMSYTVSPNTGTTRIASLTIAGSVFTVTETGLAAYTITASAGTGGSISPSGGVSVQSGANQTFTITPNSGYKIVGVTVDGVSQGTIPSYTFSAVSANHTISATFAALTYYTLSTSKAGTGSGSVVTDPTGSSFPAGTKVTLTATPDANSIFSSWSGGCSGNTNPCQVTMSSNVSVTATFNPKTYTITASAGTGGTISPSGGVSVQSGANQSFTIAPNSGYTISSVLVDSVSQGAITSYTFQTVAANHTINATFATIPNYTLNIFKNGTGSGTVSTSPTGTSFSSGTQVTLTALPDANSVFSGWSGGGCSGNSTTCQVMMNSIVSVTATFNLKTYTITASAGTGGSISPSGGVSVQSGANQIYTIAPNGGYTISNVLVDGASQGVISSYTFTGVTANHTISATFTTIPNYNLNIFKNGTGSGTVSTSPTGASFSSGTQVTLTALPDANSVFSGWSGGGCSGNSTTCQVMMNSIVSVTATFNLKTYTITASAGTGGSISPSGVTNVQSGANQSFTIAPNSGYTISNVLVDGASQGVISSYTFTGVTANHTISATFTTIPNYNLNIFKNGTGSGTVSTSPTGASFSSGTQVTLTALPDANSVFSGWSGGGCSGNSTTCQVMMNSIVSVTATFNLKTYTITASAGTGGTISPSGGVSVQSGANQSFTIAPNSGYTISSVLVDSVSQGAITSYTFQTVAANHTINATFATIPNYTLNIFKNGTGSGSVVTDPTGSSFPAGTKVTLTAAPDANSTFGGWSGACSGSTTTCQVAMNSNVSVTATFSAVLNPPMVATGSATLIPSSSAQLNGTVNPKGLSTTYVFQWGRTTSYGSTTAVTPAGSGTSDVASSANITRLRSNTVYHYRLKATNSAGTTYGVDKSFTNNNNQIYTITATAGTGGAISPSGEISVQSGANQTFTIAANAGYKIANLTVDRVSRGAISSYTFSTVNANHTIVASFVSNTYTLTITNAGTGSGSVSSNPTGTSFPAGTQVTLTASPDSNSVFNGWSGGCSGMSTTCQVTMNANVSVTAIFNSSTATNPPTVVTGSATLIPSSSAQLNGTVNPKGLSTTYVFQWGRTTSYGSTTAVTTVGSGTSDVASSANITRLRSNTVYHYRLKATNSAGTTYGVDKSFTNNNNQIYTITATAGTGGAISPSGGISVQSGANQTFTIAANAGYKIANVTVDEVSQGAIASYTFSAVSANHTISATFSTITNYTLTVSKVGTGSGSVSVNPTGTTFPSGTAVTLTTSPDSNSVFNGWSGGCSGMSTTCQVTMNANVSVTATFSLSTGINQPMVVTGSATLVPWSSATLNGTVNPNGLSTTYVFQWGRTTSYGNNTTVTSSGSGTSNMAVSAGITRLSSYTVYHYRLVATNSAGTTYGSDRSFKTKFTGIRK